MLLEPNLCLSSGARSKAVLLPSEVSTARAEPCLFRPSLPAPLTETAAFRARRHHPDQAQPPRLRSRRAQKMEMTYQRAHVPGDAVAVQGNRLSVSPRPALCPLYLAEFPLSALVLRPSASLSPHGNIWAVCIQSALQQPHQRGQE